MIFEIHSPSAPLAKYVENIVFYDGYQPDFSMEKLLPDGAIHVIMDMQETPKKLYHNEDFSKFTEFKGCFVSGQHKGFIHIEVAQNSSMMVLRFLPGGAFPFFNVPISKLNDKVQQAELFWGDTIYRIREQIVAEKSIVTKFAIMEAFLLKKLEPAPEENKELSQAIATLVSEPFQITTKGLAKQAGMSQKHLISLFDRHVGLTPKYLARIYRFQKVILMLEEKKKIDWMQIVSDCGYYDQAHFVKDFYQFSGINPSKYMQQKGEYLNYIPIK